MIVNFNIESHYISQAEHVPVAEFKKGSVKRYDRMD